jgi:hypothetical protein
MAAPTFGTITPTSGPTGGRALVTITGTNFRLPTAPAFVGPIASAAPPSVEVFFGTSKATNVRVLSSTRIQATLPAATFDPTSGAPGAVSVSVRNIDDNGVPIPGEAVVVPSAFSYARPTLETPASSEPVLAAVVRTLLLMLRREVLDNVQMTVHTDYAGQGAEVAAFASLPGIAVVGPALSENRFYSENEMPVVDLGGGVFEERRVPYTVDLTFTIIGADDSTQRLLNLMQQTTLFFHRNKAIVVGAHSFEMEIEQNGDFDMEAGQAVNNANLRSFTGIILIRGVHLEDANASATENTYAIVDVVPQVGVPSAILLGGVVSDGSGSPLEQDGSAPPAEGIGYIPLDGGGAEQKD